MSKSYVLRQKILLQQGKISQSLHDARIEQYKIVKAAKKQVVANKDGGHVK